jgi:hypothetical protein
VLAASRAGELATDSGITCANVPPLAAVRECVVAPIAGEGLAQAIQLALKYAREPRYAAGRPESAPAHVVEFVRAPFERLWPERLAAVQRAAAALGAGE